MIQTAIHRAADVRDREVGQFFFLLVLVAHYAADDVACERGQDGGPQH